MWAIWLVTGLAAALFATTTVFLWRDLRVAPRGWQFLAASGLPLALGGLGFAVRFWEPTAGPYLANQLYPFGPYLNAWVVAFGFMWLAFGLAFFTLALRAPRTGLTWLALLVAWVLAWLPHVVIGVAFAVAGSNQPSFNYYRVWGSDWPGFVVLANGSLILLAHFTLSVLGFAATGWSLWRNRTKQIPTDPGRSA